MNFKSIATFLAIYLSSALVSNVSAETADPDVVELNQYVTSYKESFNQRNSFNPFCIHTAKNLKRKSNQDRTIALEMKTRGKHSIKVTGVFDGHGGSDVSQYLQENIAAQLLTFLSVTGSLLEKGELNYRMLHSINDVISRTVYDIDNTICENLFKNQESKQGIGSTASIILRIDDRHVFIINIGNSKSMIIRKRDGKIIKQTKDHVPSDPVEQTRIETAGGAVLRRRLNGILDTSRAFGDCGFKRNGSYTTDIEYPYSPNSGMMSVIPDITYVKLDKSESYWFVGASNYFIKGTAVQQDTTELSKLISNLDEQSCETRAKEANAESKQDVTILIDALSPPLDNSD